MTDDRICCLVEGCEYRSHSLLDHVVEAHNLQPPEYLAKYPGAATLSQKALRTYEGAKVRRTTAKVATDLSVKMMGMSLSVDADVDENQCLPLPNGYRFPTKGKAKTMVTRALMALARGRNAFIWGMPGTGKDALVHAFSAILRRPVVMVTFRPGTDLAPWFYTRSIETDSHGNAVTGWEFGHLWRALTEGVKGRDGVSRPVLVLLSDVDRADSAQAEWFRLLTDSISGRILGPDGSMTPLLKGTQFVCTANSCGSGDARGRMASANPIDASILDRLGRKIEATYLDWEDEGLVLKGKFPILVEKTPEIFSQLGKATAAVREAIEKEELYAELTHRGLCEILAEADDILHFTTRPNPTKGLLKKAFAAWLDGLDSDSRFEAKRMIDAHITGGAGPY